MTRRLPILLYHAVVRSGGVDGRQVPEAVLESHLAALRDGGFRSVRVSDWIRAVEEERPLAGRCVVLTFDHHCADHLARTWPILRRYGFTATLSVVTGSVGEVAGPWGVPTGMPMPGWDAIRLLAEQGAEIVAHGHSGSPLAAASPDDILREAAASRDRLESELGQPVRTIAYPYGAEDEVVQHLVSACGYTCGLSRRRGIASLDEPLLSLPRIEVVAGMDAGALLEAVHG